MKEANNELHLTIPQLIISISVGWKISRFGEKRDWKIDPNRENIFMRKVFLCDAYSRQKLYQLNVYIFFIFSQHMENILIKIYSTYVLVMLIKYISEAKSYMFLHINLNITFFHEEGTLKKSIMRCLN